MGALERQMAAKELIILGIIFLLISSLASLDGVTSTSVLSILNRSIVSQHRWRERSIWSLLRLGGEHCTYSLVVGMRSTELLEATLDQLHRHSRVNHQPQHGVLVHHKPHHIPEHLQWG